MVRAFSIGVLFGLIIVSNVYAMNLGTVAKNNFVNIGENQSGRFNLLFWTGDEQVYHVELHLKYAPDDWAITIQPENFNISRSAGEEAVVIDNNYVGATPVAVYVKPLLYINGTYNIVLTATAGAPAGGISFLQERVFNLTARIGGPAATAESNESNTANNTSPSDQNKATGNGGMLLIIVSVILILVIAFLIYRYA